jgi:probable rRNA maturation factor
LRRAAPPPVEAGLVALPTDPVPAPLDRGRPHYVGACRIDIVRRPGTPPLLSNAALARTIARALEAAAAPAPVSLTVVLTDDEELAELNGAHLGKEGPTDVLSFPMLEPTLFPPHPGKAWGDPDARAGAARAGKSRTGTSPSPPAQPGGRTHLGDIAISVERAVEQAESGHGGQTGDVRWSPADELRLLATHGTLHLCGWDHAEPVEEAAMRALEQRLLAEGRR